MADEERGEVVPIRIVRPEPPPEPITYRIVLADDDASRKGRT